MPEARADHQAFRTAFDRRKVLITGGLGFLGSNLAHRLLELGSEITIIDSLVPEYGGNLYNIRGIEQDLRLNISDVRDVHSMRYLVQSQDYLFNLAGQTSHLDSMEDPYTDLDINCSAQLSILETCRQFNPDIRVVFASTRQLYGRPEYLPVDERHPVRPVDVNGVNKAAGEAYHVLYNDVHGISSTALRLTNTYGPRMRIVDARQTFVGVWIRRVLEGQPFEVWGGDQLRDLTYVEDACEAMLRAATSDAARGQVYNVGGPDPVSLAELARLLVSVNKGGEFTVREFPAERRAIDIGDYYSDWKRLGQLGWRPRTSVEDGLALTLRYFREHLAHYV